MPRIFGNDLHCKHSAWTLLGVLGGLLLALSLGRPAPVHAQEIEPAPRTQPRHVILVIVSGFGPGHLAVGSQYVYGEPGALSFEKWPHRANVTVSAADGALPDAAAAATLLATGEAVAPGRLSVQLPGDGTPLETLLEFYRAACRATGLVTTSTLTDPAVAAFGAHVVRSSAEPQIMRQLLEDARPNVLMGGGTIGMDAGTIAELGYQVISDRSQLFELTGNESLILAPFGVGLLPYAYDGTETRLMAAPTLSEMTDAALRLLDSNAAGFFLVVHSGLVGRASAENHLERLAVELAELEQTVQLIEAWAAERPGTLIVVTGDRPGWQPVLTSAEPPGAGVFPAVTWSDVSAFGFVPVFATGVNADLLAGAGGMPDVHAMLRAGTNASPAVCPAPDTPLPAAAYPYPGPTAEPPAPLAPDEPYVAPAQPTPAATATAEPPAATGVDANAAEPPQGFYLPRRVWLYPLLLVGVIMLLGGRLYLHRRALRNRFGDLE